MNDVITKAVDEFREAETYLAYQKGVTKELLKAWEEADVELAKAYHEASEAKTALHQAISDNP